MWWRIKWKNEHEMDSRIIYKAKGLGFEDVGLVLGFWGFWD